MSCYPQDIDALLEHLTKVSKAIAYNEEELKIARERLGVIATIMACQWLQDDELNKLAAPRIKEIVSQWLEPGNESETHPCL